MRSNSVGEISSSMCNQPDVFDSLLNDTEEHFRLHRDSMSSRNCESAGVHGRSEIKHSTISTIATAPTATDGSSSDTAHDAVPPYEDINTMLMGAFCPVMDSSESMSNSQLLIRQDQCCPGFAMSKSGKSRHQGNGCSIC